jgi:hypothetical protein
LVVLVGDEDVLVVEFLTELPPRTLPAGVVPCVAVLLAVP